MDDRQRLEAIVSVINKYLPPDGIPINESMSEIISLVDPLPPPQPAQEPEMLTIAYQNGYHDGKKATRARCIELVLAGSSMPVQTRTLEILQRDRKRIAKLIAEDGK